MTLSKVAPSRLSRRTRDSAARPARTFAAAGSALVLALIATSALAVDTVARDLAASCAACHGTEGRSSTAMPSLAGRDRAELLSHLVAFKTGARSATVMHQHAKGYSEAELEALAGYFAAQAGAAR